MHCLTGPPLKTWGIGAGDAGDAAMAAAFDEVIGPAAERFQPDIILVRAALLVITEGHGWTVM